MARDEDRFIDMVRTNPIVTEILRGAEALRLPDWYLTAGGLFQTVWNHCHGYPPDNGILNYDLFYCDTSDLSWAAEDAVIRRAAGAFSELGVSVQVRNQARVHLWFEDHFGITIDPFLTTEDAIRNFLATACCVGMKTNKGDVKLCTPYGLEDLFGLTVKPNRDAAGPGSAYVEKTSRWARLWPQLTILPWSEEPSETTSVRS